MGQFNKCHAKNSNYYNYTSSTKNQDKNAFFSNWLYKYSEPTWIWVWRRSNPLPAQSCSSPSVTWWGQSGRSDTGWCCTGRCSQQCAGAWGRASSKNIRRYSIVDKDATSDCSGSIINISHSHVVFKDDGNTMHVQPSLPEICIHGEDGFPVKRKLGLRRVLWSIVLQWKDLGGKEMISWGHKKNMRNII